MNGEPYYWISDMGQILEYVVGKGPTALSAREVCRRLNNQLVALVDLQDEEKDLRAQLAASEKERRMVRAQTRARARR